MRAHTRTIKDILAPAQRYCIPPYQRPYVWQRKNQWAPLWEDVLDTVERLARARRTAFQAGDVAAQADQAVAPHFLGAIVVEQLPTAAGDIGRRAVVDGQQRLTTIQLLVRGIVDAIPVDASSPTRKAGNRLRKLLENDPDEVTDDDSVYKVWPRRAERAAFKAAMASEAPAGESSRFAAGRRFFAESARRWLDDPSSVADAFVESAIEGRVGLLEAVVAQLLKLVVIDLESVDDAQVIFEVLNARNTPLTAADLVKNLLFMRAEREAPNSIESLYEEYWRPFDDDDWWSEKVGTGHAARPRLDRFLGNFLVVKTGAWVNLGHLYGAARDWIRASELTASSVLAELHRFAQAYKALQLGDPGWLTARERRAAEHLRIINIVAADPLLMWLISLPEAVLGRVDRERAFAMVESYLVRRMATKVQTRAYNAVFTEVLAAALGATDPVAAIEAKLLEGPHGYHWPDDRDIERSFLRSRAYGPGGMNRRRLRLLLGAVDRRLHELDGLGENVTIEYADLTIEHVMPQSWEPHWPLQIDDPAARFEATQRRNYLLHCIGNLTLLTHKLNPTVSNGAWGVKRDAMSAHSALKLNGSLIEHEAWTEDSIAERGRWLAGLVVDVWPRPEGPSAQEDALEELIDDETLEIVADDLAEQSAPGPDGRRVFTGDLSVLLTSLGVVAHPEHEAELPDVVRQKLVENGRIEVTGAGLVVVEDE